MPSKMRFGLTSTVLLLAGAARAAVAPHIELPKDSPVVLLSADYSDSAESVRGGALEIDLHAALTMRNNTQRRVHGVALAVTAQDVTPGGKGSVTLASLDVAPGESFPVRIDMRLLRPLQNTASTPVQVSLDGVLFEDLSFYGPDKLNSRRTLTLCEAEARRDRRYFKALLSEGGPQRVQNEMVALIARRGAYAGLDVQMVRGRATNSDPGQEVQFAFVKLPDAPVEPLDGMAHVSGNEARAPKLAVMNRSGQGVRYLEIGWILRDRGGREFLAGSVPAELNLAPGQKSEILKDTTLKFPRRPGQPLSIDGMTGFVSSVEFSDGKVWIPSRSDLADPRLQRVIAPSLEEQRLLRLYQKKGLKAVLDELSRL